MTDVVQSQPPDSIDVDLDSFFLEFPTDFDVDIDQWLPSLPTDGFVSPDSFLSSAKEIEKFLMDDDAGLGVEEGDKGFVVDDFVSGLLVDGSDSGKSEAATTPESGAGEESERKEKRDAVDGEEGDGPISKKRRRKLMNRDSAIKSRERKKMYIKDLEMKSKYLESECRRLDYAVRCCMVENLALHQRLQKERPHGVSTAGQESAVLFVESLLLGSLFWLVSIVCLFLMPSLQSPNLKVTSRLGRDLALEAAEGPKTVVNRNVGRGLGHELIFMRRRCRGARTRMKLLVLYPHVATAA